MSGPCPPPVPPGRIFSACHWTQEIPNKRAVHPETSALARRVGTPIYFLFPPNSPNLWTAQIWYGVCKSMILCGFLIEQAPYFSQFILDSASDWYRIAPLI